MIAFNDVTVPMDQEDDTDFNQEAGYSTKRRRIGMACIPCRSRKGRCDGARPRCSYCARNRSTCTYQPASQMVNVSQDYIWRLKQRAEAAELRQPPFPHSDKPEQTARTSVQEYGASRPARPPAVPTMSPPTSPSIESPLRIPSHTGHRASRGQHDHFRGSGTFQSRASPRLSETGSRFAASSYGLHARGASTTAAGSGLAPVSEAEERPRLSRYKSVTGDVPSVVELDSDNFYGDSSSLSFIQAVKTTMLSNSSPESLAQESPRRQKLKDPSSHKSAFRFGAENCLLQRSMADDLVGCYFRYVHILYPFLHEPTFQSEYQRIWTSSEQQDSQLLAILNVIFALGIHFAYDSEDKSEASDRFFGYAQKLVSFDHFADANLRTLQLLLLSGLYYQSTSRPNQTWNVIGLAIRIATSIGAHIDPLPSQYNPLQIELRRRCWYGCVVLDRVLALNFGRPTAIPDSFAVTQPSNIDDQYITEEGYLEQPSSVKSKVAVFIKSISFCSIMNDVLYTLYSPPTGSSQQQKDPLQRSPDFKDAVSLDKRLIEWFQGLPHYLQAGASDEVGEFQRARNILLARFLNVRVLIHRPFASLWQQYSQSSEPPYLAPLENSLHAICVTVCKSAAIQLVEVISRNYYQGLSSAWWTDMNYLFTAGTVLLALEYEMAEPNESESMERAFKQSMAILQEMQTRSSMASSYVTILEKAKEALATVHNQRQTVQVQPNLSRINDNRGRSEDLGHEATSNIIGFDDLLRTDLPPETIAQGWNMQDLFLMPWDMMVDNPMPSFQS